MAVAAGASTGESRETGGEVVQFARGALGAAAAIAAAVYLAGGIVVGTRLLLAHLTTYEIVGQLPRDFLLAIGASEVVLPAAVATILYALYRSMGAWAVRPSKFRNFNSGRFESIKVIFLTAAGTLLLTAASIRTIRRSGDLPDWLVLVFLGIAGVWTVAALHLRERLSRGALKRDGTGERYETATLEQYNSPRRLIGMIFVVAAWCALGVAMYQAVQPFPDAAVCTRNAGTLHGRLIGTSGQDVFLSQKSRIRVIPRARVAEIDVGSPACGER